MTIRETYEGVIATLSQMRVDIQTLSVVDWPISYFGIIIGGFFGLIIAASIAFWICAGIFFVVASPFINWAEARRRKKQ